MSPARLSPASFNLASVRSRQVLVYGVASLLRASTYTRFAPGPQTIVLKSSGEPRGAALSHRYLPTRSVRVRRGVYPAVHA